VIEDMTTEVMQLVDVGIDATNLMRGGGRTHLIELIRAARPLSYGVRRVVVWGAESTLRLLPDAEWLYKETLPPLNKSPFSRLLWQYRDLSIAARKFGCDVLFVPGGSYFGNFSPVVTMSQNMLPFDLKEMLRYRWSSKLVRLGLLRAIQGYSFRSSNGVIFLTNHASKRIAALLGPLCSSVVIPHGIGDQFKLSPRLQNDIGVYSLGRPFELVYVSVVDVYKHQASVIEGVHRLREETGWPIELHLVGPSFAPALRKMYSAISRFDPKGEWVRFRGNLSYDLLPTVYANADAGIFASSCENLPIILLEMMGAGLPIACSNRDPMPQVLGAGGVFFDPESPREIASALKELLGSPSLRARLARAAYDRSSDFTWEECANLTFEYLVRVAKGSRRP
jgi:glycosyltransferase involved in cell wall biosynthesis